MKHKIGDTVKIKSWDCIDYPGFVKDMSKFCGKYAKIISVNSDFYTLDIDNRAWNWDDWMFEDDETVKEPTINDSLKDKRFHAACCALQGMLANPNVDIFQHKDIAIEAYKHADQMLKQGGFYDNL